MLEFKPDTEIVIEKTPDNLNFEVEAVCIRAMTTHHYQPQYLELNL